MALRFSGRLSQMVAIAPSRVTRIWSLVSTLIDAQCGPIGVDATVRWARGGRVEPIVRISDDVRQAVEAGDPVVALESTIISHGMPYPQNVEMAAAVESILRQHGATPATIAVI